MERGESGFYFGRKRYLGQADNASELQALSRAAQLQLAADRREKRDTALLRELRLALVPMRRAYQATNYEGRLALEVLALQLLRQPVRPEEEEGE